MAKGTRTVPPGTDDVFASRKNAHNQTAPKSKKHTVGGLTAGNGIMANGHDQSVTKSSTAHRSNLDLTSSKQIIIDSSASSPTTTTADPSNSITANNTLTSSSSTATRTASSPWSSAPRSVLHAYRRIHRLPVPSCHISLQAEALLTQGLGLRSPSMMVRRRLAGVRKSRVDREMLASAVRKHFNALPVNENEVLANVLYVARLQDDALRLRFTPYDSESLRHSNSSNGG